MTTRERRNVLGFALAIVIGLLLVAGGLLLAALYGSMNFWFAVPAIICFAVAAFLGNRFGYLFE